MSIKIFTLTHKEFETVKDPMYIPLHVGRQTAKDLGYLGDNTGENISLQNCYYSELTGIYWIWKNYKEADYVGVCHYRRYLINEKGRLFREAEYEELLKRYDVITTKTLELNVSYLEGYGQNHNRTDLLETGNVIRELYPEYYIEFERLINSNETYFGNIMVTSKELFDEYASWLFSIFFEVQKRIDVSTYDDYHKRVFGFISEMLLKVWVTTKNLSVCECMVGMVGEKYETRELKNTLAEFFEKKDIKGAKDYFLKYLEKRPDVLMEASDTTGELKLSMQVIATSDMEMQAGESCVLDDRQHFSELMNYFKTLNKIVNRYHSGKQKTEDAIYLKEYHVSALAIEVAIKILNTEVAKEKQIFLKIAEDLNGIQADKVGLALLEKGRKIDADS